MVRSIVTNPSVCVFVYPRAYRWNRWTDRREISCADPCGCRSILLRWRCAALCTSGFIDDATFGRNGRDAERWRLTRAATAMNGVAIPGRSLCGYILTISRSVSRSSGQGYRIKNITQTDDRNFLVRQLFADSYWCSFSTIFLFYCTQLRFVQLFNKAYDDDDEVKVTGSKTSHKRLVMQPNRIERQ